MALLSGIIFYNLGTDQLSIRDRFSIIFLMSAQVRILLFLLNDG